MIITNNTFSTDAIVFPSLNRFMYLKINETNTEKGRLKTDLYSPIHTALPVERVKSTPYYDC